jgi:hypothetical protein
MSNESSAASVREREYELALAKVESMSRPLTEDGRGRAEWGSLATAAQIAREALRDAK